MTRRDILDYAVPAIAAAIVGVIGVIGFILGVISFHYIARIFQ